MSSMPLEGYRILDLCMWVAGAGGTVQLADMGADVIKIEDPIKGDPARAVIREGTSVDHLLELANRNKRAMTLNLKTEEGRRIFYRMVESADVVAENFRPGVAERLGVDHATLCKYNPSIILASCNGAGSKGPDTQAGSMDPIAQARSGLMDLMSDHSQAEDIRYVGGHALADMITAIMFANAILAGLASRAKLGIGQHVEVSQLSACMALQSFSLHQYLFSGRLPSTPGRKAVGNPLSNIYRTKDGRWLAFSGNQSDRFWLPFCRILGLSHLENDSRFMDRTGRQKNSKVLIEELDKAIAKKTRDEWVALLKGHDVVCGPVQNYDELLRDPQVLANGYIQEVEHPTAGRIKELAVPISFSETQPRFRNVAPEFGQQTEEILLEFGYTWDDIGKFRSEGTI